jgi:hypothetical protein
MTQAADFVAKARSQVGVVEGPKNNETIYGKLPRQTYSHGVALHHVVCGTDRLQRYA